MSISVLVIEDEPAIQALIAFNLELAGYGVVRTSDAESALQLLCGTLPDLVLVDWMLPGQSGIDFIRRLRSEARTGDLPVIMLTAREGEQDKILGLENGADDYMTKPFSSRELLARIQSLLRRRTPYAANDAIEIAGLRLDLSTRRVVAGEYQFTLGPTEFRLLHFLMNHPRRVHSRAQLLNQVWSDHICVEERTVDVHVRRLRGALEPSGHHMLIETVRGSGYRLAASEPE